MGVGSISLRARIFVTLWKTVVTEILEGLIYIIYTLIVSQSWTDNLREYGEKVVDILGDRVGDRKGKNMCG